MKTISILLAALLAASAAPAKDLTGPAANAVSEASGAIASANICNFRVDTEALGRFLDGKLGPVKFESGELARAMYGVLGSEAIILDLAGLGHANKAQVAAYCRQQIGLFGPTGTKIPGVLIPPP